MNWKVVVSAGCELGEGPLWHSQEHCLYWADIQLGRLHRYDPATREHDVVLEGRPIGGMTYQADGSLLLFRDRGTVEVYRNGRIERQIIDEIAAERSTRFNDVIADPLGRVFCGTMSTEVRQGQLYCVDLDGSYRVVVENVSCSNGMGFTPDLKRMYHTDSLEHTIWIYDYCQETGELSNRQVFAKTEDAVLPDGLTVDSEGNVWAALWGGAAIVRFSPDGTEATRIALPTANITSLLFAGDDLTQLFVTSAALDSHRSDENPAGDLFLLTPGVTGRPEFPSRIGLDGFMHPDSLT